MIVGSNVVGVEITVMVDDSLLVTATGESLQQVNHPLCYQN